MVLAAQPSEEQFQPGSWADTACARAQSRRSVIAGDTETASPRYRPQRGGRCLLLLGGPISANLLIDEPLQIVIGSVAV